MGQPTIKDVAKIAGVSISTVSRVMNKSKPVSPEAQRKVEDAINKLGFKPNELARSLVMRKSNSIGILIKDIGIDYMAQMVRGAEEIGRMYQYDILLTSTYGELELEKKAVDFLSRKQVEGIIVVSEAIDPEIIVKIRDYKIPYMILDRFYDARDKQTVSIDYPIAMQQITDYVLSLGNKKLLYLDGPIQYEFSRQKLAGFRESLAAHGLEDEKWEAEGTTIEDGYQAMENLMKKKKAFLDDLDCLVCANDDLALGVISYCYDHDIVLPDRFQLVGFGGSQMAEVIRPKLTTLQIPNYDIGAVAMRMLTKVLKEKIQIEETTILPAQVIEGQTTRKRSKNS